MEALFTTLIIGNYLFSVSILWWVDRKLSTIVENHLHQLQTQISQLLQERLDRIATMVPPPPDPPLD